MPGTYSVESYRAPTSTAFNTDRRRESGRIGSSAPDPRPRRRRFPDPINLISGQNRMIFSQLSNGFTSTCEDRFSSEQPPGTLRDSESPSAIKNQPRCKENHQTQ
jgi:hypothetical protein